MEISEIDEMDKNEREQEMENREKSLIQHEDQLRQEREDIYMKLNESASSTFLQ